MLYIMLAYLMLFIALFIAACLHNAYLFFAIDICKCYLFSCFVFGLLLLLSCNMYSAVNHVVFLILCLYRYCVRRGYNNNNNNGYFLVLYLRRAHSPSIKNNLKKTNNDVNI